MYGEEKGRFRSGCCTSIVNIVLGGSWVGECQGLVSSSTFDVYTNIQFLLNCLQYVPPNYSTVVYCRLQNHSIARCLHCFTLSLTHTHTRSGVHTQAAHIHTCVTEECKGLTELVVVRVSGTALISFLCAGKRRDRAVFTEILSPCSALSSSSSLWNKQTATNTTDPTTSADRDMGRQRGAYKSEMRIQFF